MQTHTHRFTYRIRYKHILLSTNHLNCYIHNCYQGHSVTITITYTLSFSYRPSIAPQTSQGRNICSLMPIMLRGKLSKYASYKPKRQTLILHSPPIIVIQTKECTADFTSSQLLLLLGIKWNTITIIILGKTNIRETAVNKA